MLDCKECRNEIKDKNLMECPSCGATFCKACATKNKDICVYCYSSLLFKG